MLDAVQLLKPALAFANMIDSIIASQTTCDSPNLLLTNDADLHLPIDMTMTFDMDRFLHG